MSIQKTTKPLPEHLKNMSRDQFLAARKPGEMVSHDDLYWILYRSASEATSFDSFFNSVESLLDASLGENNYVVVTDATGNGHGGAFDPHGNRLPNNVYWGGDAGLMPGFMASYAVTCVVFTG